MRTTWRHALLAVLLLVSALRAPFSYATSPPLVADHRNGVDGSCNGITFSSSSGGFSAADVGKIMVISGDSATTASAGSGPWNNAPLFTTVASVTSSTVITLNDTCNLQGVTTAQWDLGTDNTAALQSCVNGGNCSVPAGSYLVSGTPTTAYDSDVLLPSNSQLLCQPGAEFVFPHHDTYGDFSKSFIKLANVQNVTVSGCTITGTNLHAAFTKSVEFNYPIVIVGSLSMNNRIVGNTIRNGWSDGEIIIDNVMADSPPGVPVNNTISGNTISNCGLNGLTIVSGNGNILQNNTLVDCNIDIEPNSTANGPVFGNLIKGNVVKRLNRPYTAVAPQGTLSDTYGVHYILEFSSCGDENPACDTTGGDTTAVVDNTFVNEVHIAPYCRGGATSQTWLRNATTSGTNEDSCALNAPGCSYGSCVLPASDNAAKITTAIVNSMVLDP